MNEDFAFELLKISHLLMAEVGDVEEEEPIGSTPVTNHTRKKMEADDDPMIDEKLSSLYTKFYTWLTKTVTRLPASAPVAVQMMKGLETVKKRLKGKENLRGRAAVEALADAMSKTFTLDAAPWPYLKRKYGREIESIFRGW